MNIKTDTTAKIVHENILIGVSLSLLGGFLDAYSYILKGGVFANAQTGNLVLLTISLINRNFARALAYCVPLFMFALGILLSELFKSFTAAGKNNRRIKLVLAIEAGIVILVAFVGRVVPHSAVNCVISFLAAIQVANFDRINGNPVATTMITGNLRSGMTQLNLFIKTRTREYAEKALTYALIIAAFAAGVALGSILCKKIGDYAILTCLIFIASAALIIKYEEKKLAKITVSG